ncbi:MAG: hypothetical protein WC516_07815 [Patescibacteria group bacterium]|jgi:hypothetical protein
MVNDSIPAMVLAFVPTTVVSLLIPNELGWIVFTTYGICFCALHWLIHKLVWNKKDGK